MGRRWLDILLFGTDSASRIIGESCTATDVEGCLAANENSGIWTYASGKVAGELVLEVGGWWGMELKFWARFCSLDDLSTSVVHDDHDILSQASRGTPCPESRDW